MAVNGGGLYCLCTLWRECANYKNGLYEFFPILPSICTLICELKVGCGLTAFRLEDLQSKGIPRNPLLDDGVAFSLSKKKKKKK